MYKFDDQQPNEVAIEESTNTELINEVETITSSGATGSYKALAASSEDRSSNHSKRTRNSKKKFSIFKKKKSRKAAPRKESKSEMVFHIVREGQDLQEIAMIHKLDETTLRLRNRIPKDAEPLSGEYIYLRKKISVLNRPQFSRIPNNKAIVSQDEYIF